MVKLLISVCQRLHICQLSSEERWNRHSFSACLSGPYPCLGHNKPVNPETQFPCDSSSFFSNILLRLCQFLLTRYSSTSACSKFSALTAPLSLNFVTDLFNSCPLSLPYPPLSVWLPSLCLLHLHYPSISESLFLPICSVCPFLISTVLYPPSLLWLITPSSPALFHPLLRNML